MAMKVQRIDTWAAALQDKPGGLAARLSVLAQAGANLEFVIARRAPDRPGKGVLFVTPIQGVAAARAARAAGFKPARHLHTIRIEGPDRRGQGARITRALAQAGINLRGFSAATMGKKFVAHLALDTTGDATRAARTVQSL